MNIIFNPKKDFPNLLTLLFPIELFRRKHLPDKKRKQQIVVPKASDKNNCFFLTKNVWGNLNVCWQIPIESPLSLNHCGKVLNSHSISMNSNDVFFPWIPNFKYLWATGEFSSPPWLPFFFLQGPDLPITSDTLEDVVTLMPGAPNDLGNLWRNGWVPRKI